MVVVVEDTTLYVCMDVHTECDPLLPVLGFRASQLISVVDTRRVELSFGLFRNDNYIDIVLPWGPWTARCTYV